MTTNALVALGSNLGDRRRSLWSAVQSLDGFPGIKLDRSSGVARIFESVPVLHGAGDPGDQPLFLNSACAIETDLDPRELLDAMLALEKRMGRERLEVNAPRVIDLDLLLYGALVCDLPGLTVPHPRMHVRGFVLYPVCDIAGDWIHPVLDVSMAELRAAWEAEPDAEPPNPITDRTWAS